MSTIFYDRLVVLEDFGKQIKKKASSKEEELELWGLVDEILGHKVLDIFLGKLHPKDHSEFLEKFIKAPFDETILDYLKEKIGENIEELVKEEIGGFAFELLQDLKEKNE